MSGTYPTRAMPKLKLGRRRHPLRRWWKQKHVIEATCEVENADGDVISETTVQILFRYVAPGPGGGTWNRQIGSWDPPDDEEIEFFKARTVKGKEIPPGEALSIWAEKWLADHTDEARKAAAEDEAMAREDAAELRAEVRAEWAREDRDALCRDDGP